MSSAASTSVPEALEMIVNPRDFAEKEKMAPPIFNHVLSR